MFLQWLSNKIPWIRYIRQFPGTYSDLIIARARIEDLEDKVRELDAALVARSSNESSMAKVLKAIETRVNSTGYRRPPTLRRKPGESDEDLMKRYRET